jgi:hypothetical protein
MIEMNMRQWVFSTQRFYEEKERQQSKLLRRKNSPLCFSRQACTGLSRQANNNNNNNNDRGA